MAIHDGPIGMVIRRAARLWYSAECAADPKLPANLTDGDIYALAIPRVRALFAGEVRWSETSPGDKAIWRGRPRRVQTVPPRMGCVEPRLDSRWENLYDTVELEPERCARHHTLFGCGNIGNLTLTNMQVAGQLAGALTFDISQMYAEISRDLSIRDAVVAQLVVGGKLIGTWHLRDLALGVPIGRTVGERQGFEVRISRPVVTEPLTIVMHLEGPVVRPFY